MRSAVMIEKAHAAAPVLIFSNPSMILFDMKRMIGGITKPMINKTTPTISLAINGFCTESNDATITMLKAKMLMKSPMPKPTRLVTAAKPVAVPVVPHCFALSQRTSATFAPKKHNTRIMPPVTIFVSPDICLLQNNA